MTRISYLLLLIFSSPPNLLSLSLLIKRIGFRRTTFNFGPICPLILPILRIAQGMGVVPGLSPCIAVAISRGIRDESGVLISPASFIACCAHLHSQHLSLASLSVLSLFTCSLPLRSSATASHHHTASLLRQRHRHRKFIELLRRGTAEGRDSAIKCLRTVVVPW
ncbi:hypothetical protein RHMOL_Rhmol01G0051300 [Rhododendron molle]|uniref:Uncharacterized protein n=1 Tax=Rhododendron molle TaxID=49168 RepID=A0ACC0PY51_RHOML|nr:hypothetical protein RHMOL_Rhmol01G0051300 [Rhododendron molle]